MTKKAKEVEKVDLTVGNIKVGVKLPDLHGEEVEITDDIIEQMRRYEKESGKSAIWKNKITGKFLFFKYYEDNPEEKLKTKKKPERKPKKVEEDVDIEEIEAEEQVEDEENLLKDAIEDYKSEYGVKTVNTKSQKFKRFFYNWKNSN